MGNARSSAIALNESKSSEKQNMLNFQIEEVKYRMKQEPIGKILSDLFANFNFKWTQHRHSYPMWGFLATAKIYLEDRIGDIKIGDFMDGNKMIFEDKKKYIKTDYSMDNPNKMYRCCYFCWKISFRCVSSQVGNVRFDNDIEIVKLPVGFVKRKLAGLEEEVVFVIVSLEMISDGSNMIISDVGHPGMMEIVYIGDGKKSIAEIIEEREQAE